jgi:TRAP-type C4-dicarboxylate transport system substrate-binding protein
MMKKLAVALAITTALMASAAARAETLRFGHANAPGEVLNDMFNEFAEKVKERTNGELEIQVFPSEQLGKGPTWSSR